MAHHVDLLWSRRSRPIARRFDLFSRNPDERRACMRIRVFLDGAEVTSSCQVADEIRGEVLLLVRNAEGFVPIDPETLEPVRAWRAGAVEIAWKD